MTACSPPPLPTPGEDAYRLLAPFYDGYTHHPAYAEWISSLEQLASACGLRGTRALDVGCGTGKSAAPLLELGYRVSGCDPSQAMLDRAAVRLGPQVPLSRAGLPELPLLGKFDLVTAINDVLNYVEPSDLQIALHSLVANVAVGGVLLFDTTTLGTYRRFFGSDHVRTDGDVLFAWRGRTAGDAAAGSVAEATLDIVVPCPDGCHQRMSTVQRQRHHPEDEIRLAIQAAELDLVTVRGQGESGPPRDAFDPDAHLKAIWVCRKP
jgi:SAM-dependent methyltransferase